MSISENLAELPVLELKKGEILLNQEETTNCIYFLKQGKVRVVKDGVDVARISDAGAVFGEMAILLGIGHSATVECMEDCNFYRLDKPEITLGANPELLLHIARLLSLRLFNLNQYLVDIKAQFEGHDHLGMVDQVLETLLNQQKTGVLKREDSQRDTPDY